MLEITDLIKIYDSNEEALSGVSVSTSGNEIVAIIGPSGAGKSTLIKCINRLIEPTAGSIVLDGTELTTLSEDELRRVRRDIGMVYQEYNLVERLTVMENVLSGRLGYLNTWRSILRRYPSKDVSRAYEILDIVGMDGHEDDRVDELSGGQRQRVGIARAILQDPKILLADEPTSSLDPETSHAVMELLSETAKSNDVPVLINIHEVELALEYADQVIGLSGGKIVFRGTPDEVTEEAKDRIYRGATPSEAASDVSTGESTEPNQPLVSTDL